MKAIKVKAGWPGTLIRLAGGRRWEFPANAIVEVHDDDFHLFSRELATGLLVEMQPELSQSKPAGHAVASPPAPPPMAAIDAEPPKTRRRARDAGDGA